MCLASQVVRCLTDLLKHSYLILTTRWTTVYTAGFERLRILLLNALILVHPDFSKDFIVYSHTSKTALVGLFAQFAALDPEGVDGQFSRRLVDYEHRHSSAEREIMQHRRLVI